MLKDYCYNFLLQQGSFNLVLFLNNVLVLFSTEFLSFLLLELDNRSSRALATKSSLFTVFFFCDLPLCLEPTVCNLSPAGRFLDTGFPWLLSIPSQRECRQQFEKRSIFVMLGHWTFGPGREEQIFNAQINRKREESQADLLVYQGSHDSVQVLSFRIQLMAIAHQCCSRRDKHVFLLCVQIGNTGGWLILLGNSGGGGGG
jgi:hypothetical protein